MLLLLTSYEKSNESVSLDVSVSVVDDPATLEERVAKSTEETRTRLQRGPCVVIIAKVTHPRPVCKPAHSLPCAAGVPLVCDAGTSQGG